MHLALFRYVKIQVNMLVTSMETMQMHKKICKNENDKFVKLFLAKLDTFLFSENEDAKAHTTCYVVHNH